MYVEAGGSHHTPHFHAYDQDQVGIYSIDRTEHLAGSSEGRRDAGGRRSQPPPRGEQSRPRRRASAACVNAPFLSSSPRGGEAGGGAKKEQGMSASWLHAHFGQRGEVCRVPLGLL